MVGIIHPFSTPLSDLSTEELDQRYSQLMNRYHIARRMQMDQGVIAQLDMLLNSVEDEKYRRQNIDEPPNGSILETDPAVPTTTPRGKN